MNQRVALISGITGQDGSYLAELLLEKGYHAHRLLHEMVDADLRINSMIEAELQPRATVLR